MGFINQFPYSDFHELNLDWIITKTKELTQQVNEIAEEFAKIQVLTEDQINAMINSAIASNNIEVYTRMNDLKNQITSEYQTYVYNAVNSLKTYVDNLNSDMLIYVDSRDTYYNGLSQNYADNALNQAKTYTDDKVLNVTMMTNPITGEYDDVRNVVTDIVNYFHTENTLTASEYDLLEITAQDYDNAQLTAYDYDYNGKNLLP